MEATPGFEPGDKGFADLSLSHLGTSPYYFFSPSFGIREQAIENKNARLAALDQPSATARNFPPLNTKIIDIITQIIPIIIAEIISPLIVFSSIWPLYSFLKGCGMRE